MRAYRAPRSFVPVLSITVLALSLAGCGRTGTEPIATDKPDGKLPVVPVGLPEAQIPADNPMSAEKIELGKMLYFDKRLSKDGTVSCATCHDPKTGWTERRATSEGIGGQVGGRNSPSVINTAYFPELFWDGRAKSLEDQALGPIQNPVEMGHTLEGMIASVNLVPGYKPLFKAAFGDEEASAERVAKAIASFERTVLSGDSAYDKYKEGDASALSEEAKRGLAAFERIGCDTCHTPPLFTNGRYYNAGIGMDKEKPDEGRKDVTGLDRDLGKFRVAPLKDAADTAPYFHDGSAATLEDAVAVMAGGGKDNPNLSSMIKSMRSETVTDQDKSDLVAFLKALSGSYPVVEEPKLPE